MEKFCQNQVEAIGKEADHVQIAALSRCLKVSLDVAYLSRTGAPPATPAGEEDEEGGMDVPGADVVRSRDDPGKCDIVLFEIPGAVAHIHIGTLLFRPGHYDVLINAPEPASPEMVIPKRPIPINLYFYTFLTAKFSKLTQNRFGDAMSSPCLDASHALASITERYLSSLVAEMLDITLFTVACVS